MTALVGGVVSISMTDPGIVREVKIADGCVATGRTAIEVVAWAVKGLVEGTGRGTSESIGGGESTHIGVGDSVSQEGG